MSSLYLFQRVLSHFTRCEILFTHPVRCCFTPRARVVPTQCIASAARSALSACISDLSPPRALSSHAYASRARGQLPQTCIDRPRQAHGGDAASEAIAAIALQQSSCHLGSGEDVYVYQTYCRTNPSPQSRPIIISKTISMPRHHTLGWMPSSRNCRRSSSSTVAACFHNSDSMEFTLLHSEKEPHVTTPSASAS